MSSARRCSSFSFAIARRSLRQLLEAIRERAQGLGRRAIERSVSFPEAKLCKFRVVCSVFRFRKSPHGEPHRRRGVDLSVGQTSAPLCSVPYITNDVDWASFQKSQKSSLSVSVSRAVTLCRRINRTLVEAVQTPPAPSRHGSASAVRACDPNRLRKKVLRGCRYATLIQIAGRWRTKDSSRIGILHLGQLGASIEACAKEVIGRPCRISSGTLALNTAGDALRAFGRRCEAATGKRRILSPPPLPRPQHRRTVRVLALDLHSRGGPNQ
jgi:hypothetical protein